MTNKSMIALTNDQMRAEAPAIFSQTARPGLSQRYGFISTERVIDALRGEGLVVNRVQQSRTLSADNRPFARHAVSLCLAGDLDMLAHVGDTRREIMVTNEHRGGQAFDLYIALFRLWCENGAVVSEGELTHLKVWHTPHLIEDVIEGSFRILERGEQVMGQVADMKRIQLPAPQQLQLAERAHSIRFPDRIDKAGIHKAPWTAADLLGVRRSEDASEDLWTVYQRIQENALKGNLRRQDETEKWRTSRPVRAIPEVVRLNQQLWEAACEMMVESRTAAGELALV
jgi:hypothetical protein